MHSEEYLETFGTDTVPHLCGFKSEARAACTTFVGMADLTPVNCSSENIMYSGSLLIKRLNTDLSIFNVAPDSVDGGDFCYTKAVKNASNSAYRRIYGGKFNYCF